MRNKNPKIWFPAKTYGYGRALPCAWQGWVVMAAYLVLVTGGVLLLRLQRPSSPKYVGFFVAYMIGLSGLLCLVCWWRGEKPEWRWGGKWKRAALRENDRRHGRGRSTGVVLDEAVSRRLIAPSQVAAQEPRVARPFLWVRGKTSLRTMAEYQRIDRDHHEENQPKPPCENLWHFPAECGFGEEAA
jgi:hypothetical protein